MGATMTLEIRRAPVRTNSYDPATRTFQAVVTTGAPVQRRDYEGPFQERLSLDQEWPSSAPLLNGHRAGGIQDILGRVTGFQREGDSLIAHIKLSSRPELDGLGRDIQDGIVDSLSVGYEVEEWREQTINNERTKTAVKWKLHEVSLVPLPADAGAKVRGQTMPEMDQEQQTGRRVRAASERTLERIAEVAGLEQAFIDEQLERGATENEARRAAFEEMEARSASTRTIRTQHNERSFDNPANRRAAMAEAFAIRMTGGEPSEAAREFMGNDCRSFADAAITFLEATGESTRGLRGVRLIERAYTTTSDFPAFLTEVGNRTLAPRFQAMLSPVVGLARRKTAADFRAFSELRLGTGMRLEPVNEHGELKSGSFVESKEAMRIASYGKTFSMSFQALANDDLGAFNQITSDLADAAANTVSDLVVDLVTSNPKLGDNKAVFHVDHKNLSGAGSTLSETSLAAAQLAMRKQVGIAGERIRVEPTHLVVPPELELTARKLLAAIQATTVDDVNPFANAFTLAVEPRLADQTAWYLIDPTLGDLVDAYLSGYEGPQVETRQGWETLGSEWRCHMHYGTAFLGFRGWHKASGAAVMAGTDWGDPCAAHKALREAYHTLLAGKAVALVEFEVGTGTRRRVEYHKSSISELRREMERQESLCKGRNRARVVKFATSKGL